MTWLGVLTAVLGVAEALLRYLHARRLIAAGEAAAAARHLRETMDAIDRAQALGRRFDRLDDGDIGRLQRRDYRD